MQQQQPGKQIPEAGYQEANPFGEARQASAEEQQLYNRFVAQTMLLLYDDKFMPTALEMVRKATTPMEGIARVVSAVGMRVFKAAQEAGDQIPGSILLHAGLEVTGLAAEMAAAAGLKPLTPEEIEAAFYLAAEKFAAAAKSAGMVDEGVMAEDAQKIAEMAESQPAQEHFQNLYGALSGGGQQPQPQQEPQQQPRRGMGTV